MWSRFGVLLLLHLPRRLSGSVTKAMEARAPEEVRQEDADFIQEILADSFPVLFALDRDPGEQTAGPPPADLDERYAAFEARYPRPDAPEASHSLSPETREQLEILGYAE